MSEAQDTTEHSTRMEIEDYINDVFSFGVVEPDKLEPTERDIATKIVFDHAARLVELYADNKDSSRIKKPRGNKTITTTLPRVTIDNKEFELHATFKHQAPGVSTINLCRPNVPSSGFTLTDTGIVTTLTVDSHDKANLLDSDEERYKTALEKATEWIDRYAEALNIPPEKLLPVPPLSPKEIKRQQKMQEREAKEQLRRRKARQTAAKVLMFALGSTLAVSTGATYLVHRNQEQAAEHDATRFLPEGTPTIHIGETKPVSFEPAVSQDIIDDADEMETTSSSYMITADSPHFIRMAKSMTIASKSDVDWHTSDCEIIPLKEMGSNASVRVATIKSNLADHLEAHLERTELRICNTYTEPGKTKDIKPKELFVEVTNPDYPR